MSMTPETPTPETDADYKEAQDFERSALVEPLDKFLKLERELDAARAEIEAMREAIKSAFPAFSDLWNLCPDVPPWALDNADAALAKLKPFIKP